MASPRKPAPSPAPTEPLATPAEVAAYLKVPEATLKDWRRKKTGPRYRPGVGRHVRYSWADVRAWYDAGIEPQQTAADNRPAA